MEKIEEADDGAIDVIGDEDDGPVDIIKIQQDFYESFIPILTDKSTHGYSEVLNKEVLKDMIKSTVELYTDMNESEINSFSDCLWEQKKFTGSDDLRISQLFVCCVHDTKGQITYPLDIKSTKFSIRPIYRVPKCFKKTQHQRDCCAVFIDEFARVYKTWSNFCEKNKYGNCLIIAPKGGFYDATTENKVELDIFYQKDGVIKYFDYGSTAASLGSAGVLLVGLLPVVTLAPVVATGATFAGVACAGYAAVRSVYQLFDRKKHDQSIGIKNKESRAAYFNITSGALCAGAAVGSRAAIQAALNRQTLSKVAQRTITYVGASSIGFQAVGCADELISIISDLRRKKPISTVYLAQFGAQIFLLALSVKNFKLTEKLTEVSGQRNPKTIRKMLRNNNSDGSLKYLFSGADFLEKNINGFTANSMMIQSIFTGYLNVSQKVKVECEKYFDERLKTILDILVRDGLINKEEFKAIDQLLKYFLETMNLSSLDKFFELTKKFVIESAEMPKSKTIREFSFDCYLKSVYISMIRNQNNTNINDFLSALTNDSFDMMVDEIRSDGSSIFGLCCQFDDIFGANLEKEMSLGRKISLIIEERCQIFVTKFIEFPIQSTLDNLALSAQYVLRRLAIEAATLFFGITKQILNECVAQFINQNFSQHEFIKKSFQMLLKKCNGNLTNLEKYIKVLFDNKNGEYDRIKKDILDHYFSSRQETTLKECKVCGGENFI
ncbi:uncharacterized protein LOC116340649 [Contarinia nasturtii]|uniref:uncharacterized protein LOC116340649 n=1 Tax=Contarinia nasturtii TaxID=265458 RepID=UPI0012D40791|nr:uncharacterized protein LOC116340649 [Contarinia nasturtii]XP_031623106.1 uncharacterized protein LOC116340649 [Contarinia nasturtii]